MMKLIIYIKVICIVSLCTLQTSCNYLDVVPDNVPTLEHAFANRLEAEKYLRTCYSFLPDGDAAFNILFFGADDMWTYYFNNYPNQWPWRIARGEQNPVTPLVNYWDGERRGLPYFRAIRECNIFIENISNPNKVQDLEPDMRSRWLAEAKFLKAYYHFYLLRMYGPIPIVDVNLPIDSSPDQVKVKREPFDDVVDYIADLLDEIAPDLPVMISDRSLELGRVTRPAALMLKARLLVLAASPLFNGNPDYRTFHQLDGTPLFNPDFELDKWERASKACYEALVLMDEAGHRLYQFNDGLVTISNTTWVQMNIRGAVTEPWNPEIIWGWSGRAKGTLQQYAFVKNLDPSRSQGYLSSYFSPTLQLVEQFYTENGVPINEDKTWDYSRRYDLREATQSDKYNIKPGYTTARLHFDREPRFYASLGFDGGIWYMQNAPGNTDENAWHIEAKFGQRHSKHADQFYSETGYWVKKLVNWKYVQAAQESNYSTELYPWPDMRLADLFLLYAEALNELGRPSEAIPWIDRVRARAGLEGVVDSWSNFSNQPNKYNTQEGLREIIQNERMIELAFEGSRIWDIRRWKIAEDLMNKPVKGWDINQREAAEYYRPKTLWNLEFVSPRDYLWPIKENNLLNNSNLVQNPGWQ